MTTTLTCGVFNDRLMAYVEEETDAVTRAAMERHAVTCAECGALLADLRKLRIDAANLPDLAPSRDLWAGIAARIEAPVVPIGPHTGDAAPHLASGSRRGRSAWRIGLLAASLAGATAQPGLALGADTGRSVRIAVAPESTSPDTTARVAAAPAATRSGTPPASVASGTGVQPAAPFSAQLVVAGLTADYDREIARLNALLENRRNQLDPATVAIIERNLQLIDAAIAEAKQAIARDPASRFLIESLNQSLQMKVELMRTAAMLPSRI
jgi:anti-sigma factor RsiW